MKRTCKALYQPEENVAIDERMVRSKARFAFCQVRTLETNPLNGDSSYGCWLNQGLVTHGILTCIYIGKNVQRSDNGLGL